MIIGIKHGPRLCRVFSNILKCSIIVRGGIQHWGTGHRYHLSWRLWQPNLIECPKKQGKIIVQVKVIRKNETTSELMDRIIVSTNNQNPMSPRNLKSNSSEQKKSNHYLIF